MELDSTYRDIQEDELSVLQSIYDEDIKDLRPQQKKWIPLDVVVHLRPSATDSIRDPEYCSLDVRFVCKNNYPRAAPVITFEKPRNISVELLTELHAILIKQMLRSKKKEIIFDLCTTVSNYLAEKVKPPPEATARISESFYEQMLRDKEIEEIRKQEEENERERKNKKIQSDFERQKEMLNRLRKTNPSESPRHLSLSLSETFSEPCDEHQRCENIYLMNSNRRICLGSCLGHSQKGCINYGAIDLGTGQLLFVTEWLIKPADVDKVVESTEKRVTELKKLRHKNLIAYEDVHFVRKRENLQIYLIQEFCQGISVSNSIFSNLDSASAVAKGVLDALIFLHNNGVTHGNLLADNVLLDSAGAIRVTDFSVVSYLQELCGIQKMTADLPALGILMESIIPTPNGEIRDFISRCRSDRTLSGSDLVGHAFLFSISNPHSQSPDDFQILPSVQPSIPQPSGNIPIFECTESSRLESEFKVINDVGKGAYGDVMKVQKMLDNKVYAIKRIPLSTRNRQLYKKMIREVELLSRLNHENVVRYYNSWIETTTKDFSEDESEESEFSDRGTQLVRTHSTNHLSSVAVGEDSSDEESSSESYGLIGANLGNNDDDSNSIIFANSNGEADEISEEISEKNTAPKAPFKRTILYIQMEFCDKSTLRTAIDNNLCHDKERLWRLFREIGEGLMHIHQQGMIHRDLKPVNIFLDSKDNVKIGDFGLATTSILALQNQLQGDANQSVIQNLGESQTGQVGTALYVAPELSGKASKSTYTQKVDLYSLGIILFEMCTPPAVTGMERIKTLAAIRQPEIKLPSEMEENNDLKNIIQLLKWLLDHNPVVRPTAEELLQSELVPPAKVEAYELQDMIRNVLANSTTSCYKHLVAKCLAQECRNVQQVIEYHRGMVTISSVFENVRNKIVQVMRKHGAIDVTTPLLTPYFKTSSSESTVRLMTHSGSVVVLPNDLHSPFLCHVALNGIQNLRRYSIGRVYCERKVHNFHPKQVYECAFDIVTTSRGHFMVESEVLALASEIIREFEVLMMRKITLRINHTNIVKAIFSYFSIPAEKQKNILKLVANYLEGKMQKTPVKESLKAIMPDKEQMTDLLLTIEGSISNVKTIILKVLKGKNESTALAKGAFRELELVTSMSQAMGLDLLINMCPGFTNTFDCSRDGCINWQMIGETKARKMTVFASGGRYDNNLTSIKEKALEAKVEFVERDMFCVGFSIAIDKIITCLTSSTNSDRVSADVVVYVYGPRPSLKYATQILRELWAAGIRSCFFETLSTKVDFETPARELGATQILIIGETESLQLKSWQNENYVEQNVARSNLVEVLRHNLTLDPVASSAEDLILARNSSVVNASGRSFEVSGGGLSNVDIVFICSEKPNLTRRKRLEILIDQKLAGVIQKFNKKESFAIFAVDLDMKQLKILAGCIESNSKEQTKDEIDTVLDKFPRNKQKYLREIYDEIVDKIADEKTSCIAGLYGIKDSSYRLII